MSRKSFYEAGITIYTTMTTADIWIYRQTASGETAFSNCGFTFYLPNFYILWHIRFTIINSMKKFSFDLVAERSEANQNRLQFPTWCRRRDSNSQALRRTILSRVRLPISTLRQFNTYHSISISSKNQIPILLV